MPLKELSSQFTPDAHAEVISDTPASHEVIRGRLKGSSKIWIVKKMVDLDFGYSKEEIEPAHVEILSQEFFRLIIPQQIETRLLWDRDTEIYYICSEEIAGFRQLPDNEPANFINGTYPGLGRIVLIAAFLQEADLKNGNIGLNQLGEVTKIDGDSCFLQIQNPSYPKEFFGLSAETINRLPYPKDFFVFNWLDMVRGGTHYPESTLINDDLADSIAFRAEINEAMLKICSLPDALIHQFVHAYSPNHPEQFIAFIKERRP